MAAAIAVSALVLGLGACSSDDANTALATDEADQSQNGSQPDETEQATDDESTGPEQETTDSQATGDYCTMVTQLQDLMISDNADSPEGATAARELAALAPDAGIADDWNALAGYFDAAQTTDMNDSDEFKELTEQWDVAELFPRLGAHTAQECGLPDHDPTAQDQDAAPDQNAAPDDRDPADPDDYCAMSHEVLGFTLPYPTIAPALAAMARELADVTPEADIAAEWNTVAALLDEVAKTDDHDHAARNALGEEWDYRSLKLVLGTYIYNRCD
jgi:hypothetical protein